MQHILSHHYHTCQLKSLEEPERIPDVNHKKVLGYGLIWKILKQSDRRQCEYYETYQLK